MTDLCILHALLLYFMGHCLLQLCLINHFSWTMFDLLCFHQGSALECLGLFLPVCLFFVILCVVESHMLMIYLKNVFLSLDEEGISSFFYDERKKNRVIQKVIFQISMRSWIDCWKTMGMQGKKGEKQQLPIYL